MKPLLSICIPTYNGKEFLEYNINKLININKKNIFEICVSDNASTDGTNRFMLDIVSKYQFIKYHRNEQNFGMAYNFDKALKIADGKYRWLLGDDDEILVDKIEKVIKILTINKPDICIVSGPGVEGETQFVNNVESQMFTNKNDVLEKIACQMNWISCCILSEEVVKKINIEKVNDNIFPHLIEILKYLEISCSVYWINDVCAKIQEQSNCRYTNKILEYCIKDWCEVTKRIDGYSEAAKLKFINSTVLLKYASLINLLRYRKDNIINFKNLKLIHSYFKYYPITLRIKFYIVMLFPRSILLILSKIIYILKGLL